MDQKRPKAAVARRRFLQGSAAAVAASVALPYFVPRQVLAAPGKLGANDRINVGIIGTGERVGWLCLIWGEPSQMRLVAMADCNNDHITAFEHRLRDKYVELHLSLPRYEDYRAMLDKEKLDGVFITTPTHGRVLPCIHAAQAGLGIYAEKPVTLTIDEGHALIKAIKKYGVAFQAGTQARSLAPNDYAVSQLQSGKLGKVTKVEMSGFNAPRAYKPLETAVAKPEKLNWDMWCNQAPLFPYDPTIAANVHGWGRYREFDGGGDSWGLTGYGTHAFDQVLWALNRATESPVEVLVHKPGEADSGITLRFADGLEIELGGKAKEGPAFGGIFICEHGKMEINRYRFATNPSGAVEQKPDLLSLATDGATHVQNWIDGVRTGKPTRCPVEVAHRQTVICHMVCVARDLKRSLRFDPATDRFIGDDEANRHPSVARERRKGYELPAEI